MNLTAEQILERRRRGAVRQPQQTVTGPTSALETRVGAAAGGMTRVAAVERRPQSSARPPVAPSDTTDADVAAAYKAREFQRRAARYKQQLQETTGVGLPERPTPGGGEFPGQRGVLTGLRVAGERLHRFVERPGGAVVGAGLLEAPALLGAPPITIGGKTLIAPRGTSAKAIGAAIAAIQTSEGLDLDKAVSAFQDLYKAPKGFWGSSEIVASFILPPFGALPVEKLAVKGVTAAAGAARRGAAEALVRVPARPVQEAGLRVAGFRGALPRGATEAGEALPPAGAIPRAPGASVPELPSSLAQPPGVLAAAGAPPVKPPVEPPIATAAPSEPPFAANIRLSKYPEDIRGTIKEWAAANPAEVQSARRGVRSDATVQADAQALVEDMGGDFTRTQKQWKPGEAWNAEEILAIRGTLRQATEKVGEAARLARSDNSAANHAQLLIALQEHSRVQELVHGVTAEAGRALRVFRQQAWDAIKANDTRRLEELLARLGDRAKLDDIAAGIARLDLNNPVAVSNFIRSVTKPKFWDYVMELYINGILSGPRTHVINALSNTVNMLASPVERFTAAGVERILAPLQGRQVDRFFAEVPADLFGAIEGLPEGVMAALSTIKNGITPAQASKWEFRRTAFRGAFGRIVRGPGTALEAADTLNFAMNYRAALNAIIVRQVNREGLKGEAYLARLAALKSVPTETLIQEASRLAEYRLFRQEGAFAASLIRFREQYPILRFVIPFVRTPINILKFGLERSPVGLVDPRLWRNLAAKNPEASDQIARIFIGSSLAATAAWFSLQDRLTGPAPTAPAERDRFYREGKLPFAVKVGNTWVQYQRLEPFNQALAQVAVAVEALKQDDKTALEKVGLAVANFATNISTQASLSGLNDLFNMVTQPERYGARYAERFLSGLVPFSAALRTGAQVIDPTVRRPRTATETIQAGIPGLSQNVPPAVTAFGEEVVRKSPAISPIQFTPAQQGAIDKELERLGVEVGFVGKTIAGVELSREAQLRYQILAGRETQRSLLELVNNPLYRELPDAAKEKVLRRAVESARDQVRDQLIREQREAVPAR